MERILRCIISLLVAGVSAYPTLYPQPMETHFADSDCEQSICSASVRVSPLITVLLDTKASSHTAVASARSSASDPLVATIMGRYQKLLRNKASWAGRANPLDARMPHPLPPMPTLLHVWCMVTAEGPTALALGPDTNESYAIEVSLSGSGQPTARVKAVTAFGLRHGLETLAQLVATPQGYIAGVNTTKPLHIVDGPVFPYRGVMIDTGRHYLSLGTIRHIIVGMSALKLNVLHWHIMDAQSFPLQSDKFPQLSAKGAYSAAAVYTLDELSKVVEFARSHGVRVVPEIEMPGHGSFSAGMPELSLTSCGDVLDPTKNQTYDFLVAFLTEVSSVFSDQLLYLGGDEVGSDPRCSWPGQAFCGYRCFDKDPSVAAWMQANDMNSTRLLDYFWEQVTARVVPRLPSNKTVGVWMADTPNGAGNYWPAPHMATLPHGAVANVYQAMSTARPILDTGSPVVLSIADSDWYLDYHPAFAQVYSVRPCDANNLDCANHPVRKKNLLGGSVSQWGELVDAFNIDADMWPGAAALAERLWSDPPLGNATTSSRDALGRHQKLQCHWAMWGISTYTRLGRGSAYTQESDTSLSDLCPADWSVPPEDAPVGRVWQETVMV